MFFINRHRILIDYKDLSEVLAILAKYEITWQPLCQISLGNCGWKLAPYCWFITWNSTDHKYYKILKDIKKNGIDILSDTVGY